MIHVNKKICALIAVLLVITIPRVGLGQSRFTMHHFGNNLAQANMLNPAVIHKHKAVLGLPVMSGVYLDFANSGISFKDIFSYSKNLLDLNSIDDLTFNNNETLSGKISPIHQFNVTAEAQLLYIGLRVKEKSHFSLGLHTIVEGRVNFPGALASWIMLNSIDKYNITSVQNLASESVKVQAMAYHQISLSYARDFTPSFTAGIRAKYLVGIAAVDAQTPRGNISLRDNNELRLESDGGSLYTAGVKYDSSGFSSTYSASDFFATENSGVAFDIGAVYRLGDRLSFSLALNDLGFITWKKNTHMYKAASTINYTYEGGTEPFTKNFDREINRLQDAADIKEETGVSFTTSLVGKMYLGVNYRVYKEHTVRALFYGDVFKEDINPSVSLAYNVPISNIFSGTVGALFRNGRFDNFSLGFSVRLGPVQLYAATDRFNSIYAPENLPQGNLQAGINLVFNKAKKKEKKPEEEEVEEEPPVKEEPEPVVEPEPEPEPVVEPEPEPEPVVEPEPEPIIPPDMYHYVVLGAFEVEGNALQYSEELTAAGYNNTIKRLTEKDFYYVYLTRTDNDKEAAVRIRSGIIDADPSLFSESWILSIEKGKEEE